MRKLRIVSKTKEHLIFNFVNHSLFVGVYRQEVLTVTAFSQVCGTM